MNESWCSRFADDIELMTGSRPGIYWLICWKYLSPLAMLLILISSFVELVVGGSGYDAWIPALGGYYFGLLTLGIQFLLSSLSRFKCIMYFLSL